MNLQIQGRHLPITPALNQYVKTKIKKVKQHFDRIIHAHVVLQKENQNFIAEVTLTVGHHHFHNKVSTEDMYKSIDWLFDKLERQVRRYKEALADHRRRQGREREETVLQAHTHEINNLEKSNKVFIDDLPISPKPMSRLEAVLQLGTDTKRRIMGFHSIEQEEHLSFLIKEPIENQFSLIAYDHFWEFSALEVFDPSLSEARLETHHVEPIQPSLESIEDALDFLLHNESRYRFFTSLRTEKEMLLFERNQHRFSLLREDQTA